MTLAANYLELAERHSDCVNRPLASGGNTSGNVKRGDRHWAAIGSVIFLHDRVVAAARWWDEGGSSLSCDGRASTRLVVQKHSHEQSPGVAGWIDSNDFCRNQHVCFRVRRGSALGATLVAMWRTNGGRIASIWASRDS